jgi:hypothetical protein
VNTGNRAAFRLATAALALVVATVGIGVAGQVGDTGRVAPAVDTSGLVCVVDPGLVDVFPRLIDWREPARSGARAGDTLAHFVVCEVVVDALGHPYSVRALGCEDPKGVLCDSLVAALKLAEFTPALQRGKTVPAVVVIGATVASGSSGVFRIGPPVVGAWSDSLCSYHGRVYGSAELDLADRPYVTRRVPAVRPQGSIPAKSGAVKLKLIVAPDGTPCFILCEEALPTDRGFVEAAVEAARQYRFEPGRRGGQAQAVWVTLDFRWE